MIVLLGEHRSIHRTHEPTVSHHLYGTADTAGRIHQFSHAVKLLRGRDSEATAHFPLLLMFSVSMQWLLQPGRIEFASQTKYGWLGEPLRGPTDGCIDDAAHTLSCDANMYRIMPRAAYTWMLPSRTVLAVNARGCHELNMLPIYTYMDFAYSSLFFLAAQAKLQSSLCDFGGPPPPSRTPLGALLMIMPPDRTTQLSVIRLAGDQTKQFLELWLCPNMLAESKVAALQFEDVIGSKWQCGWSKETRN